jgi:hypothetical protein
MQGQIRALEISDFSGGITDNFVGGSPKKAEIIDNLLITEDNKLLMRPGSELFCSALSRIPTSNRIGAAHNFQNDTAVFVQSAADLWALTATTQAQITGPSGASPLIGGNVSYQASLTEWRKHVLLTDSNFAPVTKVYRDSLGAYQARTAGLPALASTPTATSGTPGATNTWLYAAHYAYEYTVGDETFVDYGPTKLFTATGNQADVGAAADAFTITGIPQIAAGTQNYDTANIKIRLYRTENAGTTYYYVGEVTNGTTSYTDTSPDATVAANETLYTTGGVLDNDPPPPAKYLHAVDDVVLYGYCKDSDGTVKASRIRQSVQGDGDSCPATFYVDLDDDVTGVSSINQVPIAFTKSSTYRIDGLFDEIGRGGMTRKRISDTLGCINHAGIVQIEDGLVFPSESGFCFTDGYRVITINEDWVDRYRAWTETATQRARIRGSYDRTNRLVYFTIQSEDGTDCDTLAVLDLKKGLGPVASFTTQSGEESFAPSAICFFENDLIRADSRGYIFRHDPDLSTDPLVDTSVAASTWGKQTIVFRYKGPAFDFGSGLIRQWVPRITLYAMNRSDVSIQINSTNDNKGTSKALEPIRFRGNLEWGDPDFVWGAASFTWNFDGLVVSMRHFPAQGLRCSYKQIEITNAHVIVTNSDTVGIASVNPGSLQATLNSGSAAYWPTHSVGYFIAFESDGYTEEFEITARTDDTLTLAPAGSLPASGNQNWVIRGKPKGEILHLLKYVVHHAPMTRSQDSFDRPERAENA